MNLCDHDSFAATQTQLKFLIQIRLLLNTGKMTKFTTTAGEANQYKCI